MPDGRFLGKGVATSEQLAGVSLKADFLFTRCLPHLDVEGRMAGTPRTVKAIACPLRDEMTVTAVESALSELATARLIIWYRSEGTELISYPNFRRHQKGLIVAREAPSKLPPWSGLDHDLVTTSASNGQRKVSRVKVSKGELSQVEVRDREPLSPGSGVTVDVPEAYSAELRDLLSRVDEPRTWTIEMRAMLDGMPGHVHATPEQLGRGIRDFLGNGKAQNPSLRQFRRYVEGAVAEDDPRNGIRPREPKFSPFEQSRINSLKAFGEIAE